MKKYVLYPGVGKMTPNHAIGYIESKQLAACYRVPYSECLDMGNWAVKKAASLAGPITLIHLIPNSIGIYKIPSLKSNKLILVNELHKQVNTNG